MSTPVRRPLAVLAAACATAAVVWHGLALVLPDGYGSRDLHLLRAVSVTGVVLPAWALVTRTLAGGVRLPQRKDLLRAAVGALAWLGPFGAVMVVLTSVTGWIDLMATPLGSALPALLWLGLLVLLFEAVPEELLFRDLIQRSLSARWGRHAAAVAQAVLFAAFALSLHGSLAPELVVLFLLFGLSQGYARLYGGSVVVTIASHWIFQVVMQASGERWRIWHITDPDGWFLLAPALALVAVPVMVAMARITRDTRPPSPAATPTPTPVGAAR